MGTTVGQQIEKSEIAIQRWSIYRWYGEKNDEQYTWLGRV
jgi:hypothetical protein